MATLGEHTLALLKQAGLSQDEIAAFSGSRWLRNCADGTQHLSALPETWIPAKLTDSLDRSGIPEGQHPGGNTR